MAKVTGPLFSTTARNKFAGSHVYSPWKNITVVRKLVKPAQPRSPAVMNVRIKMHALGKVSKAFTFTSTLAAAIKAKTPPNSVWNADWMGVAIKQFQADNDAYDVLEAEYLAHPAKATWDTCAENIGLSVVAGWANHGRPDHPAAYESGLALYSLAKAVWYRGVLDENDVAYTNPKDWGAVAITAFCSRIID